MPAMNPALQHQIRNHMQAIYTKNLPNLLSNYGGVLTNIPEETMNEFKRNCQMQARNMVMRMLEQNRMQQAAQQQQQAQQQAMQGMQGMGMQGMGMQGM